MRVSFDSNAWEKIFDPSDTLCASIRAALASSAIKGFICEAGFRIEAITKADRATYFTQPYMDTRLDGIVMRDGKPHVQVSFGPDDTRHPGLPSVQADKLRRALSTGLLLMRSSPWMGLPAHRKFGILRYLSQKRGKVHMSVSNGKSMPWLSSRRVV